MKEAISTYRDKSFDRWLNTLFTLFVIAAVGIQYLSIGIIGKYSVFALLFINFFILSLILYFVFIKDLSVYLLLLNLFPLVYLNTEFHYYLHFVILQDFFLYGMTLLAILKYTASSDFLTFRITYLKLPLLLFFLYSIVMLFWGLSNGNPGYFVFDEFYRLQYYTFAFTLMYLVKERRLYHLVFNFLIALYVILAFEFIYMNFFGGVVRFVSFQQGYFLIILPVLSAFIYYYRHRFNVALALSVLAVIVAVGLFVTLTRALWVSAAISVGLVAGIIIQQRRGLTYKKIFFFLVVFFVPLFFFRGSGSSSATGSTNKMTTDKVEYRQQTIADPTQDMSFLMRVELGYYMYLRFIESPVIGQGLGDHVVYQLTSPDRSPVYYPDGTWFYILWKGGIIGFALFVWLYWRLLSSAWYVFKRTPDTKTKAYMLGIIAGMLSLFLFSLFNAALNKYKTNIILSIVFAFVEYERLRVDSDTGEAEGETA